MEIKQLRKEFEDIEIGSEGYHTWGMSDWQAEQCSSITIEHMKGFAIFVSDEYSLDDSDKEDIIWIPIFGNRRATKTTDELIQLYFDSLNK